MSTRAMSGRVFRARSTPSWPSAAVSTSWPQSLIRRPRALRASGPSSTRRTRRAICLGVADDLFHADGVGLDGDGFGGERDAEIVLERGGLRTDGFGAAAGDFADVDGGFAQDNFSGGDARDVEKIIEQSREMFDLAEDDF